MFGLVGVFGGVCMSSSGQEKTTATVGQKTCDIISKKSQDYLALNSEYYSKKPMVMLQNQERCKVAKPKAQKMKSSMTSKPDCQSGQSGQHLIAPESDARCSTGNGMECCSPGANGQLATLRYCSVPGTRCGGIIIRFLRLLQTAYSFHSNRIPERC